jgi:hypothetical protein
MDKNAIQQMIEEAIKNHNHDGVLSAPVNALDLFANYQYLLIRIVLPTVDTTIANVVGGDYVMPYSGSIYEVGATVDTAGVTNLTTIDINNNGTTILSTKITIDTGEKTSRTAATPSVISSPNFKLGDIITFDVDAVQTTAAKGLTMFMVVIRSI